MKNKLTWKDITIKQYLDIQNILNDKRIKDENKVLSIIPLIWPEIDPNEVPMNEVLTYINILTYLLNSEIQPDKPQKEYMIGPYSCRITDIDKMTLSQFIDYQTFSSNKSDEHLIDILGCCFVPKLAKYNDNSYDIVDFKTYIENMPITIVPTVLEVFQKVLKKLYKVFLRSSTQEILTNQNLSRKLKMKWLKCLPTMMEMMQTGFHQQ